jgi:hypothetical protein
MQKNEDAAAHHSGIGAARSGRVKVKAAQW